jgi:hypothetical protein
MRVSPASTPSDVVKPVKGRTIAVRYGFCARERAHTARLDMTDQLLVFGWNERQMDAARKRGNRHHRGGKLAFEDRGHVHGAARGKDDHRPS